MARANKHTGTLSAQAQQEIDIMRALQDQPKTPAQLSEHLRLAPNRVSYLLRGLYEANCVLKVRGSHIVKLARVV